MGKGPDKQSKPKARKPAPKRPRETSKTRLSMRAASGGGKRLGGGVKRKRCIRCIVPFVEDAAQEEQSPPAEESPPAAKRVKRQARVRTDEEKAADRNPSSCSCSSWDED